MISRWACIKPFLVDSACDLICIQETHFLPDDVYDFNLPNFTLYQAYANGDRRQGGVCVYVKNVYPHYQLPINTPLQAVACSVLLGGTRFAICSLYLPPSDNIAFQELDALVQALPEPFLLCTDANSHHMLWGADRCDRRGLLWERLIGQYGLHVLNDGSPTRMDDFTGCDSHIDVTLSSGCVAQHLSWSTDDDLHDSDHFPIYVQIQLGLCPDQPNDMFYGWNLSKANWVDFREKCTLRFEEGLGVRNGQKMAETIIQAAEAAIPKKTGQSKYSCPWWTSECKQAIAARKRALNRFRRNRGNQRLLLEYKQAKAKARQIIRKAKKDSWEKLISSFTFQTPMAQLWDILRRFTRKARMNRPLPILRINDVVIDNPQDVVNVLGQCFSDISSTQNYCESFQARLAELSRDLPDFMSDNQECYNYTFTMDELKESVALCGNTSVGPDMIHYAFLKHLDDDQLHEILKFFNYLWQEHCFPPEWTHSYIIPILKPGKPACSPLSYRPIQLTSCLCKVMERMIARRLMWYVESRHLLSPYQCAFRKGRSAVDHVVRLESEVRRGFFFNKYTLAVFLDFKSAYNLVSPLALLWKMYSLGFRGRLLYFLQSYLGERSFQVKCGCLSDIFRQETGLVQGGVVSPLLFNLMIDDIFTTLPPEFSFAMYADDCALWIQGRNLVRLLRLMQLALNDLSHWAQQWGFTFTPSKCQTVVFRRYMNQSEMVNLPTLMINDEPVPYSNCVKFLGVCLDTRLNMNHHVQYVRTRALKRVPLLKCIAGRQCGADRTILLRLYKSLIRPILEYGCQVLDGPANKAVASLECVQNTCLRIATGALRTSPVLPLQVDAHVYPLYLRRWELLLRYVMKVTSIAGHPCAPLVDGTQVLPDVDMAYMKRISGFPIFERLTSISNILEFDIPLDVRTKLCAIPVWTRHKCDTRKLLTQRKNQLDQCEVLEAFQDFKHVHPNYHYVYTDGSKGAQGVGCAFVHGQLRHKTNLNKAYSIFTAEATAILQAVNYIKVSAISRSVICTDSMSVVLALQSRESHHPLILDVWDALHDLRASDNDCIILWIPSHCGIRGNDTADAEARSAIGLGDMQEYEVSLQEYLPSLRLACYNHFNMLWTSYQRPTNLKAIKHEVGLWTSSVRHKRREEVVLCRLRLGHTRLTHSFIIDRDLRPECADCDCYLTVRHILLECPAYHRERQVLTEACHQNGVPMDLTSLLGDKYPDVLASVMTFLQASELFQKL